MNIKIGIAGNPNSGKTTLFNQLTGLSQKVGNFPGVTVEAKSGILMKQENNVWECIDFPGTYSLHANSSDEFILTRSLLDTNDPNHPDVIMYVADMKLLDKQLLLLSQIHDLGFRKMVVLTNSADMPNEYIGFCKELIATHFHCKVFDSSMGHVTKEIKNHVITILSEPLNSQSTSMMFKSNSLVVEGSKVEKNYNDFLQTLYVGQWDKTKKEIPRQQLIQMQIEDTLSRYSIMDSWFANRSHAVNNQHEQSRKLDKILTHPFSGSVIFFVLLFFIFQSMYSWSSYPMEWIEQAFAYVGENLRNVITQPQWLSDLIIDGLIPGLAGVMVFIPQIFILFVLIGLLEESGYMARVVYLFDHVLKKVGLNGRSIIGLASGGACAIPAIMSTRTISNYRDRLVTMFVIPLIPCSARIPVYTALIGFVVPPVFLWNIFNVQGLFFMALYVLGILIAFIVAWTFTRFYPDKEKNMLALQLPDYRMPSLYFVLLNAVGKVQSFITEAGKIILIIAVVLWLLATHSWPGELERIEILAQQEASVMFENPEQRESYIASKRLEYSFAGKLGKLIEPAITPLGFDWKIGIALLTSFAAREVFVGTMSTIYSIGQDSNEFLLREKLASEKRKDGSIFFNAKTAMSLILFYAFAMQCMSTFAVMYRETKTYFWPVVQFLFLGILAYLSSLMVYQLF